MPPLGTAPISVLILNKQCIAEAVDAVDWVRMNTGLKLIPVSENKNLLGLQIQNLNLYTYERRYGSKGPSGSLWSRYQHKPTYSPALQLRMSLACVEHNISSSICEGLQEAIAAMDKLGYSDKAPGYANCFWNNNGEKKPKLKSPKIRKPAA